jgi:Glycosyl hydrolase family 10
VLAISQQTADELTRLYMKQVFEARHDRAPRLDTSLGCLVTGTISEEKLERLLPVCSSVQIPFSWRTIEPEEGSFDCQQVETLLDWAEKHSLPVIGGAVIDFSSQHLPDWLWLYERDLQTLRKFMANYLGNMVKRYRRRIRRWQLTSASNSASILSLGEEELLWLTVNMVQLARQIEPELELSVGISQPWGEYMAAEERTHSPFIFADTLVRSELNLAWLDVELAMGVTPRGSYCRDLLETSRMLDLYALLGVPLHVTLGVPSSDAPDAMADPELSPSAGNWHGRISPDSQAEWAAAFAALAICKPYVQAVTWTHASDEEPHHFPNCGLLDGDGSAKPVVKELQLLREQHLS